MLRRLWVLLRKNKTHNCRLRYQFFNTSFYFTLDYGVDDIHGKWKTGEEDFGILGQETSFLAASSPGYIVVKL